MIGLLPLVSLLSFVNDAEDEDVGTVMAVMADGDEDDDEVVDVVEGWPAAAAAELAASPVPLELAVNLTEVLVLLVEPPALLEARLLEKLAVLLTIVL